MLTLTIMHSRHFLHTSAIPTHLHSVIPASYSLRPAQGCGRPAQATHHTHQSPSGNSQKSAKSASPRFADHTLQPMPGCFPHASDPHTDHILMQPQSDHAPVETSDRFHKLHINTVTQIPCGCVQPVAVASQRSGDSWGRLARGFWPSGKSVGAEFGSHIFIFVSNRISCSQNYFQWHQ